jgi:lysophospholipase L1-like esterase
VDAPTAADGAEAAAILAALDRPPAVRPGGPVTTRTDGGSGTPAQVMGPRLEIAPGRVTVRPFATSRPVPLSTVGRGATAVFLGDSYTSGWNGAGLGDRGWPALVAAARGWKVVNLAVPGTGFMNPGWTRQPIGSRVDAAIRQRPAIVFVVGGHNDSRWSPATTIGAADRLIARLRSALPRAVIVVVGPIWQNGSPPARCVLLRAGLRTEARAIGRTIFIDPLAERWFAGASHRYIGSDGLHPTDAGHRFIAQRILTDLRGT